MLKITYRKVSQLIPYANNPRDNNEKAVKAVAKSIETFGILNPIVIDNDNVVVAGHTRLLAAKSLGYEEVPTTNTQDLTQDQIKAFRIADNKTHEVAVWDLPLLEQALQDVENLQDGTDIDMEQFGFELGVPDIVVKPDTSKEFDTDDFGDDQFKCECPECGFKFNPR